MFNFASNSTKNLRFRRWSRKSYAVFASLNKVVSIGSLVVSVADKSLLKTASHISNFVSDLLMDSQEVSDSAFDELETATNNCILQTLSIQHRRSCGWCYWHIRIEKSDIQRRKPTYDRSFFVSKNNKKIN